MEVQQHRTKQTARNSSVSRSVPRRIKQTARISSGSGSAPKTPRRIKQTALNLPLLPKQNPTLVVPLRAIRQALRSLPEATLQMFEDPIPEDYAGAFRMREIQKMGMEIFSIERRKLSKYLLTLYGEKERKVNLPFLEEEIPRIHEQIEFLNELYTDCRKKVEILTEKISHLQKE